jgi:hypothetical protein
MHLKPTAGCQISILIFERKIVEEEGLYKYPIKFIKDGKVLAHFGLRLTVLSGCLTDLSA